MKRFFAAFLLVCSTAAAETPAECKKRLNDEVECFATNAAASRMLCSLSIDLAMLDQTQSDKAHACIAESRPKVESHYRAALSRLSKNPAGTSMLKDAYSTWQTVMGSLYPNSGEMKFQYDARRASQERALDEKLNRLRLESPSGGKKPPPPSPAEQAAQREKMMGCNNQAQGLRGDERVSFLTACLKR